MSRHPQIDKLLQHGLQFRFSAVTVCDMPGKKHLTKDDMARLIRLVRRWVVTTGGARTTARELLIMQGCRSGNQSERQSETAIGFTLSAAARLETIVEGRRVIAGRDSHTRKRWYRLDDATRLATEAREEGLRAARIRQLGSKLAPAAVAVPVRLELVSCTEPPDEPGFRSVVYDVVIVGHCERLRLEAKIPAEAFESELELSRSGAKFQRRRGSVSLAERILSSEAARAVAAAVRLVPVGERPDDLKLAAEPFGQDG